MHTTCQRLERHLWLWNLADKRSGRSDAMIITAILSIREIRANSRLTNCHEWRRQPHFGQSRLERQQEVL